MLETSCSLLMAPKRPRLPPLGAEPRVSWHQRLRYRYYTLRTMRVALSVSVCLELLFPRFPPPLRLGLASWRRGPRSAGLVCSSACWPWRGFGSAGWPRTGSCTRLSSRFRVIYESRASLGISTWCWVANLPFGVQASASFTEDGDS